MKLNKEQIEFLHKYTYGGWTLNEKTGLVDIKGNFYCNYSIEGEGIFPQSEEKLTNFKGVKFGVVTGNFYCSNNSLTSLVGAPQVVGGDFRCYYNKISEKTLKLVWEAIQGKKVDYWEALCILKCQIESEDWEKMSKGLENKMAQMAPEAIKTYSAIIKGASMLGMFDAF